MKVFTQPESGSSISLRLNYEASFGPYLSFLHHKMDKTADIRAKFYKYIISKFERNPSLLSTIDAEHTMDEHQEIIQLLRMSLLPLAANSDEFMMALAFIKPLRIFYYTDPFKHLLMDTQVALQSTEDELANMRYLMRLAIERCYDVKVESDFKMIKQVYDKDRHLINHHHLIIDSRFIVVDPVDTLPEFDEEWIEILSKSADEFPEMVEKFPFEKFQFKGFYILYVEDVSREVAINDLKNAILNMHNVTLEKTLDTVEVAIRELLNDSRIQIGVTPFFKINGKVVYDRAFITKCVALSSPNQNLEHTLGINEIYQKFLHQKEPYIFSSVNPDLVSSRPYLQSLRSNGIKSFMVYPIRTGDGLLGVFEVGSVEEGGISVKTIEILQQAFPVLTDLIYFMIKSFDDRIAQLIKEEFTSLQPSVEWKFNEIAWDYIVKDTDEKAEKGIGEVVFDQVHPFYGAIDIRNSSVERNLASRKDYHHQLMETKGLLEKTARTLSLPLLEGLIYKCDQYLQYTTESLTQEDEVRINEFLAFDVLSFLKHLSERFGDFKTDVEAYLQNNDKDSGKFYHFRSAYENSLQHINKNMLSFFDDEVKKLQQVYPFYFEKYRSDGIEYNIYIGQSIAPEQSFDPIYLKNIKLWQLKSMAHIARMNFLMRDQMPLPLQTTQLILVHTHPIDISFRKDEHRFDVEGSYNIRYEIIKKRIDKVRVKNTLERLTQPDKIAIVYTNLRDLEEYTEHVEFLRNKGLLNGDFELLELEELQGVSGLKAMRIGVRYD